MIIKHSSSVFTGLAEQCRTKLDTAVIFNSWCDIETGSSCDLTEELKLGTVLKVQRAFQIFHSCFLSDSQIVFLWLDDPSGQTHATCGQFVIWSNSSHALAYFLLLWWQKKNLQSTVRSGRDLDKPSHELVQWFIWLRELHISTQPPERGLSCPPRGLNYFSLLILQIISSFPLLPSAFSHSCHPLSSPLKV